MNCVDLGYGFFLIHFYAKEDLDFVLHRGLWFIGDHFLSLRPWEPFFKPSTTNVDSVAVWVRLNELPIELYERDVLRQIGEAVGKVLRIDTHTAMEARGKYVRLCVQVDTSKPLTNTIAMGRFEQLVMYEGIHSLCFSCGRVGHQKDACPFIVRKGEEVLVPADSIEEGLEKNSRSVHDSVCTDTSSKVTKDSGTKEEGLSVRMGLNLSLGFDQLKEMVERIGWKLRMEAELLPPADGALKPNFQNPVRELTRNHDPAIFVVMETKLGGERAREITNRLPFDGAIHTDTIGYAGGLWLLWNSDKVEVLNLANTEQEIHVEVKACSADSAWLFSAIYASPRSKERQVLWNNLAKVAKLHNKPWLIAGDFNEPLIEGNKFGGRGVSLNCFLLFKECLDMCNMIDLWFSSLRYTWTTKRDINDLILERIDRFFMNPSWCVLYPDAKVTHLPRCHSNHCPILMKAFPTQTVHLSRPFRFQSFWLSDLSFPKVVSKAWSHNRNLVDSIDTFTKDAALWNKNSFRNIHAKKKRVLARIYGVQRALANKAACTSDRAREISPFRIRDSFGSGMRFMGFEIHN
ncbi:uncharacterized protein LOC111988064 [Quercus suber]|uniref:uncharacterized protein LOC111988064 n=1 Tax=Quercus suber TaxID=58331 RepID=UPI0032DEA756